MTNNTNSVSKFSAPFDRVWFMIDYARERTFVREEFVLLVDKLKDLGYNGLGLYLEAAIEFESIPGVIRRGVITADDAKWINEECAKRGILVFPMTNVVGHMEHFFYQERFSDLLMEDTDYIQLNFLDKRAEEFSMQIVHEYTKMFPCGLIHIGGDETKLSEDNKTVYAAFLAKICKNLFDEGVEVAIWDDMLWMDPSLCEHFDRRTIICDWNYYGHRPESVAFFKEQGFENVIVCPSDGGFEAFINYQRAGAHLKARADIYVNPDEVEAFFDDARRQGVLNGLHTNWENTEGRNLWAQWVPIARSGLFMNGKFEAGGRDEKAIEMALFGRITPYTEMTYILQEELQKEIWKKLSPNHRIEYMREAIFQPKKIATLLTAMTKDNLDYFYKFPPIIEKLEKKLASWEPAGAFETNCRNAMADVIAIVRAATQFAFALDNYKEYAKAATLQFENPKAAADIVDKAKNDFAAAIDEIELAKQSISNTIVTIGHTTNDLYYLDLVVSVIKTIIKALERIKADINEIPLPRFDRLIDAAINGRLLVQ